MSRYSRAAWLAIGALAALAQGGGATARPSSAAPARFAWFDYRGTDDDPVAAGEYSNPILAGYYPDPSVLRVGQDYYLVNSTFSWFPGIPIWHSRDLVNWRQIGNAISRPGQLDFTGITMSSGVFAPAISHHDGRFYIVNTCVRCKDNFVITATDPAGPWSDPTWLPTVEGIDPSLFFDDDGRAWLVNNRAPAGGSTYDGHRALWLEEFDTKTLTMKGNPRMIVDGGVDLATKPIWIEGPHILKKDGFYYLIAAEGGTSVNHSQVAFRADRVEGPYRPAPAGVNPILTQRDMPADRPDPVSAAGHADLVELPGGRWAAVFLGTRPYELDFYNIGRETFLLPVTWQGGWPRILAPKTAVPRVAKRLLPAGPAAPPQTGSFAARDEFSGTSLPLNWMTMRGAAVTVAGGELRLSPGDGLGAMGKPAFAARRQQHIAATAETELLALPATGTSAGLAALQNDAYFLTIAAVSRGGGTVIRAARRAGKDEPADGMTLAETPIAGKGPIRFRISARGGRYDLAYAVGGVWTVLAKNVDATNLSTETAGGFVGTMIGPFAERNEQAAGRANARSSVR